MKTCAQLYAEARARCRQVTTGEMMQALTDRPGTVVIDCREPNEFNLGHIPGAHLIPRGILESRIEGIAAREGEVILYCASGNRSALAALALEEMGYSRVASLDTGFRGWAEAGGEIDG